MAEHTVFQEVPEADSYVALRVRCDSETRLSLDPFLVQIRVLVFPGIHNFNVHPLVLPGANVRSDDDQCARVCSIPDAF